MNSAASASSCVSLVGADWSPWRRLLALLAEAFGDDWAEAEGFERYEWGTMPGTGRPVLALDGTVALSTFEDGRLGATYSLRGQLQKVMRYKGRTEDGGTEWQVVVKPAGSPSLN